MRLLLDTHVWVWSQETPETLGPTTRAALEAQGSEVFVSPISSLEVARLEWGGRLEITGSTQGWVDGALKAMRAQAAPLTHEIATLAYQLPGDFHPDPADRMLVATARALDLTFITADDHILAYPHVLTQDARA